MGKPTRVLFRRKMTASIRPEKMGKLSGGAIVPHALRIGSWNVGFPKKEETEGTDETAATEDADEPVVTEEVDESVVTEEVDESVVTEDADESVVTEEVDESVVTEEVDESVVTEDADESVVTEDADESVVTEEVDESVVTEEIDESVVTEEVDESVVTEDADEPVVTEEVDEPVVTEEVDESVVTEEVDESVVTEDADESVVTEEVDESVVTEEVDESVVTEDADESVVTEDADESVVTEEVDESVVTEDADESVVTEEVDESVVTEEIDESVVTEVADESVVTEDADESVVTEDADESVVTEEVDESVVTEDADESVVTEDADESVVTEEVDESVVTEDADESVVTEEVDESVVTEDADESVVTEDADESVVTEEVDESVVTEEIDESVVTEVADESVVPEETEKEEPQQTPPKQEEPTTSNQSTATTTTKKLTKRQQQTQENKRKKKEEKEQAVLQKKKEQEEAKLKKKQEEEEEKRKKKEEKEQAVLQKKKEQEEAKLKKKQEEEEEKRKKKRKYIDYCKKSKCDVIALQETNNYILQEDVKNDGFTLIKFEKSEEWRNYPSVGRSGKSSDRGLAFLICNSEISLVNAVQPHPRMAYLEFKFKDVDVILMNLYAVTADINDKSQEDALAFFRYITNFIAEKNFPGILVLCGDLNAFPDQASSGLYEPFVGKNVYGSSNDHGKHFVEFLMSAELLHLNSRFAKPRNQKWTHKAKSHQAKTEVDGFLSSRTDIVQDVDTFVQTSPSDHRLIASLWCISKEYESRRKHSRINTKTLWNKYKADLGELVSLASVGRYTELVDRVLSAAPPENSPMRIFTEQFAKKDFEAYLRNAHKYHINLSKKDTVGRSKVESRMRRHQFMPKDVQRELEKLKNFKTPGMDKITSNMIKYGGAEMVTAATELFNQILNSDGCAVPQAWKTVLFGSPLQTVFPQTKTKNIVFDERVCPLVHVYSNLLAGKLSFEMHQKERDMNDMKNLFTISLLLERFSSEPHVYLLFAKFKKPMESVTVSSVLEGLKKSPIHPKIKTAFSSLLSGLNLLFKDEPVDEKPIGIYLGDLASSMLLGFVIKMIIDECDENGNDENTELKFGEKILRRIVWDDMIVLIGKNVDQLHTQAEEIDKSGRNHNLRLDTDSMVFMAKQTPERNLTVNAKTISVSKFPSVTHRNWTLVAAEKVAGASKNIKCKDGTKIGIQKRKRQIKTIISKKTILWKVSFLNKWQNEAFERFHGLPENNQEKIMKGFQDQPFAFHKRPEWKAKAEAFFKESVIPMFFENCCVWNFDEFLFVKDACSSFLDMLDIPNFPFNPRWYILTKQALFISSLKEENLLFEMAGKNWIKEVNEANMGTFFGILRNADLRLIFEKSNCFYQPPIVNRLLLLFTINAHVSQNPAPLIIWNILILQFLIFIFIDILIQCIPYCSTSM
ncbi:hypothetical protein L5515_015639 [Caenorhabditis briggsae]|uniref:Endonuclease/exonuclease/phosphatase domain-containing protein n=1 Tax=Caenorhabditis briggsae TaxID=6238 RepID=A0AAE9J8E0_CAEBR|nr:hypothetical protein L5515_015639 [Caenorhabditis briggsae]